MDLKRKEMHDYNNGSLEGPELFGPPKLLAQLHLCTYLVKIKMHDVEDAVNE